MVKPYTASCSYITAVVATICLMLFCSGSFCFASDKIYELKLAHHMVPASLPAKAIAQWADEIETQSAGKVKITIYPACSLVKPQDVLSSTAAGVCDIGYLPVMFDPRRLGLNSIVNLAALPMPTDKKGIEIWDKLWQKYPEMLDEFKGVKPLHHTVSLPISLHSQKDVRLPDDIKLMKITGMGDQIKMLKAAGASPVGLSSADWYMSLEKGIIEGVLAPLPPLTDRGIHELTPYHVDLGIGQGGNVTIINLATWKSLPVDIQSIFLSLNDLGAKLMMKANDDVLVESWQRCSKQHITTLTAEEQNIWRACAQPAADDWIKANARKGPTAEMFAYAKQLIKEL